MSAWHNRAAQIFNIDLFTLAIVILLPWSTSAVSFTAVLWIFALAPSLELRNFARSLMQPVSLASIALFALALIGTLWSDAPWEARLHAVSPTAKFLFLPLLLYHFGRTSRGMWMFVAFLVSCTLLMAVSWLIVFYPNLSLKLSTVLTPNDQLGSYLPERGIFVKDYIDQSQEFTLCVVALAFPILTLLRERKIWPAALLAAIALSFAVNMMFVIVSRTALVTMPVMLAVFAAFHLKWRTTATIFGAALLLAVAGMDGFAPVAMDHLDVRAGLPDLQGTGSADLDRIAAGILAEIAAVLCRGAGRSDTAPDRRVDCSSRPPPVLPFSPAVRSSAIRTTRP